jgi:hypothetical protein
MQTAKSTSNECFRFCNPFKRSTKTSPESGRKREGRNQKWIDLRASKPQAVLPTYISRGRLKFLIIRNVRAEAFSAV